MNQSSNTTASRQRARRGGPDLCLEEGEDDAHVDCRAPVEPEQIARERHQEHEARVHHQPEHLVPHVGAQLALEVESVWVEVVEALGAEVPHITLHAPACKARRRVSPEGGDSSVPLSRETTNQRVTGNTRARASASDTPRVVNTATPPPCLPVVDLWALGEAKWSEHARTRSPKQPRRHQIQTHQITPHQTHERGRTRYPETAP